MPLVAGLRIKILPIASRCAKRPFLAQERIWKLRLLHDVMDVESKQIFAKYPIVVVGMSR